MSFRNLVTFLPVAILFAAVSIQAYAVPTQMNHINTAQCDTLFIPDDVHEIGETGFFPQNESLFATDLGPTSTSACPISDNPGIANVMVDIRNLSGIAWEEVWYVADPETSISNYDGEANEAPHPAIQEAFRIDNDVTDPGGANHALVWESMTADGIWEINESWQFILQDYTNAAGMSAFDLNSVGVGDNSPNNIGVQDSSGSIIAISKIPEPASGLLMLLAIAGGCARRRR
jgi:hypothetical protein